MMRKLERERREQDARRAASHPVESEVPSELTGSALATPVSTAAVPPTPTDSVAASTAERHMEPRRRQQFSSVEETILDLSDEEDGAVELLSAFAPPSTGVAS
jgi:hypothetical protein